MDLSGLNSKQREAVEQINGALLILAGAGSGKTSTMTHRMAYMIEQGISPRSILAVTFT
ncbi:MAG: UvrD-helicase domain-containing protein, partial [Clostridiales bacterium]|nr:UvrD-helicase domain-containing protein [Clostridiales bacterium]